MPLTKEQKGKILDQLREKINRQKAIVFGDIAGIKVADLNKLRKEMKQNDGELKVAKKTLISKTIKESGLEIDFKQLKGEIVLGFSYGDEAAPFRSFYNFSKGNENLKILGGLIGKEILNQEDSLALAKLPGRQELLVKLFSILKAPIFEINSILQQSAGILKVKG